MGLVWDPIRRQVDRCEHIRSACTRACSYIGRARPFKVSKTELSLLFQSTWQVILSLSLILTQILVVHKPFNVTWSLRKLEVWT